MPIPVDAGPLAVVALVAATVLSIALLLAAGWLTERLLGGSARDWARRSRE